VKRGLDAAFFLLPGASSHARLLTHHPPAPSDIDQELPARQEWGEQHCQPGKSGHEMHKGKLRLLVFISFASACLYGQPAAQPMWTIHQSPDEAGIYYAGPEVSAPRLVSVVPASYPAIDNEKERQGMTVLAMVIGADGLPSHIQLLHSHGDDFDQAAVQAVQQSVFEPGKLEGKPVPVWIDVRVVFRENRAEAAPGVLITERDIAPPSESFFENKQHHPVGYTPPVLIHSVDADFADPFVRNPLVQVATVTVTVGADGLPKAVQMRRGLGFGLDKKAIAAVWHDRFLPATKKGRPVEDLTDVKVEFANF
jgi:TonB family protein